MTWKPIYPNSSFDSIINTNAAIPRSEKGSIATIAPANASPHLFRCKLNIPPIRARAIQKINGTITIGTNATVLIGKESTGKIAKILAPITPSKIHNLKPADITRSMPAIIGIAVCISGGMLDRIKYIAAADFSHPHEQ